MEYYVLEGEWGGQVYMTVSTNRCSRKRIDTLILVLDFIMQLGDEMYLEGMVYVQSSETDGYDVFGGMGGGQLSPSGTYWFHDEVEQEVRVWINYFLHDGLWPLLTEKEMFQYTLNQFRKRRRYEPSNKEKTQLWRGVCRTLAEAREIIACPQGSVTL